jgi:quercetin dioxygenase-like cupin family protein
MVIKSALDELKQSAHPVAKIIHHHADCNTLVLAFKKGMVLKEHKTDRPTTLLVIDGEINYSVGEESINLEKFNQIGIPVGLLHAIEATEDAICLLIQG